MAATETRLLVLGAVSLFEPVNGYQIRRELLSWDIEDWANVKPGSIYSSLTTLPSQGHLERHDLDDRERAVAVYTVTESGQAELQRLFKLAFESLLLLHPAAFHTALTLLPLIPRESAAEHVRARLTAIETAVKERQQMEDALDAGTVPPHLDLIVDLWGRMEDLEQTWLQDLLARIEAGELVFAGEEATWTPPDSDPGWQMAKDRERYLKLLGR